MIRLYTQDDLILGEDVFLKDTQIHYLLHVMRQKNGDKIALFNGRDGEWICQIDVLKKNQAQIRLIFQSRPQIDENLTDSWLCFAPIKQIDVVVQKATELGVAGLIPIITRRTIIKKVNVEKIRRQVIEAAEQSERLSVPMVSDPIELGAFLADFKNERTLFYLNERGEGDNLCVTKNEKTAFLVGPEGGFEESEIELLKKYNFTKSIHLGRLILRAETASISILSNLNHCVGWGK